MIQDLSRRFGYFNEYVFIDRIDKKYQLRCDFCGHEVGYFYNFMDAVNYKKENKWKSKNNYGEWQDMCPECIQTKLEERE